jgi:hypothetical protein
MINSCGEMDEWGRDRIVDTSKIDRQEEGASLVGLGRELADTDTYRQELALYRAQNRRLPVELSSVS